jgi:hypothetical protein
MMVAPVIVQLYLTNKLYLDAVVFKPPCLTVESDVHLETEDSWETLYQGEGSYLARDTLPVIEQEEPLLPPVLILHLGHLDSFNIE